jgi:hypothetical protein
MKDNGLSVHQSVARRGGPGRGCARCERRPSTAAISLRCAGRARAARSGGE